MTDSNLDKSNQPAPGAPQAGGLWSTLFDGPARTVPKGGRIFQPGDVSEGLFFVRRGLVKLSTVLPSGEEITFRVYPVNEIFGEFCFCWAVQRFWATALESSEVVEVPAVRAIEWIVRRPELVVPLVSALSERIASAYDELRTISTSIVVVRLAAKLLTLPTVESSNGHWVELGRRFTHEELAQILGVRRETLTRAMSRLKELGLVEHTAGNPTRMHRAGLQGFLLTNSTVRMTRV